MQKRKESIFSDIQDVHVIADDIIIAAKNEEEHDKISVKVLEKVTSQGIKFKKEEIHNEVQEMKYMGNLISADGMKPDPGKISMLLSICKDRTVQNYSGDC